MQGSYVTIGRTGKAQITSTSYVRDPMKEAVTLFPLSRQAAAEVILFIACNGRAWVLKDRHGRNGRISGKKLAELLASPRWY